MSKDNHESAYADTEFAKQIALVKDNPEVLDTKEKLVELWQLALVERNRNKVHQEYIAGVAARTSPFGGIKLAFDIFEDDPYASVILQFAHLDHMHEGYIEADQEWAKLADMLRRLPEYREPKHGHLAS